MPHFHYDLNVDELVKFKDQINPDYYVVMMHRAVDMPQTEIAKELGWKIGTVKSRLNRGFRDLKKLRLKDANVGQDCV